jgi:hypothetical protein
MRLDDFLFEARRLCDGPVGGAGADCIRRLLAMVGAVWCCDHETGQSAQTLMQEALDAADEDPDRPPAPVPPAPAAAPWLPSAEQMYAMLASAHGGAANFPETVGVKAGLRNIEALIRQHVAGAAGHAGLVVLWRHANPPTDEDPGGSEDMLVWNPEARDGEPRAGYVLRRRGTYDTLCERVPAKLCALLAQEWGTTPYRLGAQRRWPIMPPREETNNDS